MKRAWMVGLGLLIATSATAGDWTIRLRAISVDPNSSSSTVTAEGAAIAGSGVFVEYDIVPELDFTYMFSKHWGLELILGTSQHDVLAEGSLAGLGKIVDARVLPPVVTLQWHPVPDAKFSPYVGLGVNFTLFYDEEATEGFELAAGGPSSVDLDESIGIAPNFGIDIGSKDGWFFNIDFKYVFIDTTATIETPGALGTVEVDVDIDPWVWGIGIGRRF